MDSENYIEFDEKLIEEVEKREFLYYIFNKDYGNLELRRKAWLEISQILGESDQNCELRWQALLNDFNRCLIRSRNSAEAEGKGDVDDNFPFLYYNKMKFLLSHLGPGKQFQKFSEMLNEKTEDFSTDSDVSQPSYSPLSSPSSNELQFKAKKRYTDKSRYQSNLTDILVSVNKLLELQIDSPDRGFIEMLKGQLMALPYSVKEETKMYILNYVHEKIIEANTTNL